MVEGRIQLRKAERLADAARSVEDRKKAEEKFQAALKIFRKINHAKGEAHALNGLGNLYSDWQEKQSKAVESYEKSIEIKRNIHWVWGEGDGLANLGGFYASRNRHRKAAECYDQSVKVFEKTCDTKRIADSLQELARAYKNLNEFPKAIECVERSLGVARKRGDLENQWRYLYRLGHLYRHEARYTESAKSFEDCREVAKRMGKPNYERWARQALGSARPQLSNLPRPIEPRERPHETIRKPGPSSEWMLIWDKLAHRYADAGLYATAADYCLKMLEMAKKTRSAEAEKEARQYLEEICHKWERIDPGNNELKRVKALLKKGDNKESLNEHLYEAVRIANIETVRTLLAKGANVDAKDEAGVCFRTRS
jgi:tetratricopeptide (TPR) repeat protein